MPSRKNRLGAFAALGLRLVVADKQLISLLHVRNAWKIPVVQRVPRLSIGPSDRPNPTHALSEERLVDLWTRNWERRLGEIVAGDDTPARVAAANWFLQYEQLGFGSEELGNCVSKLIRDSSRQKPRSYPELEIIDELTFARERGLRTIVLLPVTGHYAEWYGESLLVVADQTRNDPPKYRRAVLAFGEET